MGLTVSYDPFPYALGLATQPWPVGSPAARVVDAGPSVNATCPYSGDPVADFLELDGHIWGFCNPFCRDKTAADPGAWPKFSAIVAGVNDS
jgi:glutathione S-transferase